MVRCCVALFLFGVTLLGCGKDVTPEQKAADAALADARAVLAQGDLERARVKFLAALALDERLERPAPLAEELRQLARIYAVRADLDSAFFLYERAVQQFRELAARDSVRALTVEIAQLRHLRGEERKAFAVLEEALRLARVFGDSAGVRSIELALLPSCRMLDRRDVELQAVNHLLQSYSSPPNPEMLARVYSEVGATLAFRRDFTRAAEHYQRGVEFADQAGDSLMATALLLRVGTSMNAAGRTTEAFQVFGRALGRAQRTPGASGIRSELLIRVGNAYVRANQLEQAKRYYAAALSSATKSGNKLEEGYLAVQMALCDGGTAPEKSVREVRSIVEHFSASGAPRALSFASLALGLSLERANRTADALQAYRTAVRFLENSWYLPDDDLYAESERAMMGGGRKSAYTYLLDLLLRTGGYSEAFVVAQQMQSWDLRRVFLRHEIGSSSPIPAFEEWRNAVAMRSGAEAQMANALASRGSDRALISAIRGVLDQSESKIVQNADMLAHAQPVFKPYVKLDAIPPADLQRQVGDGSALVWYVPARRSLYLFVVKPSRISVQVAPVELSRLDGLVAELGVALQQAEARGDTLSKVIALPDVRALETLRQVYGHFLRPVEGDLAGVNSVLVVLPQEYSFVPVHALRRSPIPGTPYLAEQKFVSYLPGGAWVRLPRATAGPVKTVVGLGYTNGIAWDVEYELRDIRAFYKEARLYFNQQATMASLRRESGDILHLAVEARHDDSAPWNSALTLSDGKSLSTGTTILLGDFFSVPAFPAVVVSNLVAGQPHVPSVLAPVFLSKGTGMMVGTTYTPSRKLKKFFGEVFYTGLLAGLTPQQAFRKAQQEMIRNPEFSSPLVWSSYFLWGR